MIDYINGRLADLTPAYAVVEAGGVGYGLCISLNTYAAIQNSKEIKLFVYESIREDAYTLYGFATKQERTLFVQLIAVSGVGGNTARMVLSTFSPAELCNTISTSNDKLLKTVKGVGLKTAQRIIVELHDKIDMEGIEPQSGETASATEVNSKIRNEAVSALTMLGFPPAPTHKVVSAILSEQPDIPVEQVIKIALKRL